MALNAFLNDLTGVDANVYAYPPSAKVLGSMDGSPAATERVQDQVSFVATGLHLTIVTIKRCVIWAELKAGKRKPTEDQWTWLRALPDHQAYLWRPDDWDDAVRIIHYGHRVSAGMIQATDGLNIQPLRVIQHEPTCIACQGKA